MKIDITLRNYRAFDDAHPARWTLDDGFRAFVGVNNSGKSSLLRFFYEVRSSFQILLNLTHGPNQNALKGLGNTVGFGGVADHSEVFCNRNNRDMTAEISVAPDEPRAPDEPETITFSWRRRDAACVITFTIDGNRGLSATSFVQRGDDALPSVMVNGVSTVVNLSRYEEALRDLTHSIYVGAFRNAINVGGTAGYYDLNIGEQFITQWDGYKRGFNRENNRHAIAIEKELASIFGFTNLEINAAAGFPTLQVIVDDEPYQLPELGAGLAQFIITLASVAFRRPPWLLIDEPEQNLHPSLQLDFLTTLAKYTTRGVVFATHSIGLARSVGEEIYSVRRLPDHGRDVRRLEATVNLVEFLGELSFSGYQELGFRSILLVEGTTDVPTVQRWLRLYGIEHDIVILQLGGSSMINGNSGAALSELRRIHSDIAVLIDSERAAHGDPLCKDRADFEALCQSLGFNIRVLARRATENYLTDAAVKAVKGPNYGALPPFDALKDSPMPWGKNENWRIAAEMSKDDLAGTDLGAFFEALATKNLEAERAGLRGVIRSSSDEPR
jgi:ABC-type cobalamin/Fe3+-siderophores transport system ATPase subunit